jgi:hypothetical protein
MMTLFNNSSAFTSVMTLLGILFIGWYTLRGGTSKNTSDLEATSKRLLVEDGQKLRADLIIIMTSLRAENKGLENKVDSLNLTIGDLRGQNYSLAGKIDDLTAALSKFNYESSSTTSTSTTHTKKD